MLISLVGCAEPSNEISSVAANADCYAANIHLSTNPADYIDVTYINYPDAPQKYWDILNYYRLLNTLRDTYGAEWAAYRFGKEEN